MESISSRENQKIKDILHLMASRQARRESGRFAFEGLRLAMDALDAGIPIERLFLTEHDAAATRACLRLQGIS
jgi:tRNA G18 (ribose-2'-O)-methylase SpoU